MTNDGVCHSLTDSLIQKQTKIESLTSQTTSLSLQLETERRKVYILLWRGHSLFHTQNAELQMAARVKETVIPMDHYYEDGVYLLCAAVAEYTSRRWSHPIN